MVTCPESPGLYLDLSSEMVAVFVRLPVSVTSLKETMLPAVPPDIVQSIVEVAFPVVQLVALADGIKRPSDAAMAVIKIKMMKFVLSNFIVFDNPFPTDKQNRFFFQDTCHKSLLVDHLRQLCRSCSHTIERALACRIIVIEIYPVIVIINWLG